MKKIYTLLHPFHYSSISSCTKYLSFMTVLCKKGIKRVYQKIWPLTPFIIALVVIIIEICFFCFKGKPVFANYVKLESGNLNEAQKQTITLVTELNKFIVSITTLMFGVLGFFINKYRKEIQVKWIAIAYFISLILLGFTFYFTLLVYIQLVSELSQETLAMTPKHSHILYYLEMAFFTSIGSSLILLSIFGFVFTEKRKQGY